MKLAAGLAPGSGDGRWHIVFSGDLGAPYTPLLPAPQSPWRADEIVLESTYGDRNHLGRAARVKQLKAIVERALRNRGTLIIPAFSIGRTLKSCKLQVTSCKLQVASRKPQAASRKP